MRRSPRKEFSDLLLSYSGESDPAERKRIEEKMWADYGVERAVLVMDMSGFSELTQRHGIVHYLSMVRRMQLTAQPIIESHGGVVVKFEADNCFAMFPDTLAAIRASIALNLAFGASNVLTPAELDIRISCGIDFGDILCVDEEDYFGSPVNRASKLGEDVARPGEILVTREAMDRVPEEAEVRREPIRLSISGIEIEGFSILCE
jgi:class 3 adenylate cyclase